MQSQPGDTTLPISVFYSYAHEDEPLRNELEKHLSLLQRRGFITTWHDRQIAPGIDWQQAIDSHLKEATIILLLISPDFLASDYCYGSEMQIALDRHKQGQAQVIPILLRPVDWQDAPFSHLQPLPSDKRPVILWESRDAAFLDVATGIRSVVAKIHGLASQTAARPSSPISRQNRQRLLKRVRSFWIQGMLDQSLYQAVLIVLGLEEQPDALANPWSLIVQETDRPVRSLPAGTHILRVYDDSDGELLILGEPGSGKTTLLLELARDLLDRAERDDAHPIPVVFNLSSWAAKRQPLVEWLAEELNLKYQVPSQLAKSWITTDCILPLLDGLDEVAPTHRVACLEAINTYRREHDLVPLVVCSRSTEYFSQTTRILMHEAVTVQPLTVQQIDEYLVSAGEQLAALHTVLHHDADLLAVATNPLMLNVMTLAYHGKAPDELVTTGTLEVRRRQIFAAYVRRMFEHRSALGHYTQQQTISWLGWLASQMALHNQTEFYLESMQPDWLWGKSSGRFYAWTVGHPMVYIMRAVMRSAYSGPLAVLATILVSTLADKISNVLLGALVGIFIGGVLISLVNGILHGWRKGSYTAMIGLPVGGLVGALIAGISSGLSRPLMGLIVGLVTTAVNSLLASLIAGKEHSYAHINARPVFGWSWEEVGRGFKGQDKEALTVSVIGGVAALLVGAAVTVERGALSGLILGGVMVAAGLLLVVLDSGVRSKALSKQVLVAPNQGIRLSARKGLYFCLTVGSCAFLGTWLVISYVAGGAMGWICGLTAGILSGIAIGWFEGWDACVRHAVLRVLLWHAGFLPRNYAHFLDYAVERILLRKIGGGYIFIHRILLEYFALLSMTETETEQVQMAKMDTNDATIHHNRALIYAQFSEYQQAISSYTRAIELDPKEASTYRDRAVAYARTNELQQALADLTRAIDLEPKNAFTYRQRGLVHGDLEAYEPAIQDFTQAITLEPKRALTYGYRGRAYYACKEFEKAVADFTKAIELDPQNLWYYRDRGRSYINLDEYEKAVADFTRTIRLAPQEAPFYWHRGWAYVLNNQYPEALTDLSRAIDLAPDKPWLYDDRGSVYAKRKEYERAVADYTRAIELDAGFSHAYFGRGYAYLWLKKSELARADFVQHATLTPGSVRAAWMVIYANFSRQHPGPEIVESLEKTSAINPQSRYAKICQGVALGLQGNYSDGLAVLEQSIQAEEPIEDAFFWKGLFCAYLEQDGAATEAISQALQLGLPPVLLTPLYWLEQGRPEFYYTSAVPLLVRYNA